MLMSTLRYIFPNFIVMGWRGRGGLGGKGENWLYVGCYSKYLYLICLMPLSYRGRGLLMEETVCDRGRVDLPVGAMNRESVY